LMAEASLPLGITGPLAVPPALEQPARIAATVAVRRFANRDDLRIAILSSR
jgi:hypothetical protein